VLPTICGRAVRAYPSGKPVAAAAACGACGTGLNIASPLWKVYGTPPAAYSRPPPLPTPAATAGASAYNIYSYLH